VPLRTFEPVLVRRAPDPTRVRALEHEIPGAPLFWIECTAGEELRDFDSEDGASIRYAVMNLGAHAPAELENRIEGAQAALCFKLEPIASP
jgi:hypothetical protein